ncbi:hypothetical protein Tco_1400927 [Tanacetum coccineum]
MAQIKYCRQTQSSWVFAAYSGSLTSSAGFGRVVDFLRGSNLRYALTTNPTIYDSLLKQFWQTATANTNVDGSLDITATIDTIRYTISEASIRDSIQLEDATGITMLPNEELFEGMGQTGYPTNGTFTFWKSFFTPQWRYLVHHLLHCISPKSGGWDQFGSNIATALVCLSTAIYVELSPCPPSLPPHTEHVPSLNASMEDLLHEVPKLISRIEVGEWHLKQTKLTMGNAIVKLVKKVKKMEGFLKRRNLVLTDSEEEEPEAQGRKSQADPQDSSVQGLVTPSTTKTRSIVKGKEYREEKSTKVNTGDEQLSTGDEQVSVVGAKMSASDQDKGQREGKAPMISEETPKKSKEQILQEKLALLIASVDTEHKRRAKLDASAELSKSNARIDEDLKERICKENGIWKLSQLKSLSFEEVKKEFDKLVKQMLKQRIDETPKKSEKEENRWQERITSSVDKDDSKDSDEDSEQDDFVKGTKTPINHVPVAMKTPSIATYRIIKQGEKGAYQIVRKDGTDIVYINFGAIDEVYIYEMILMSCIWIGINKYGHE